MSYLYLLFSVGCSLLLVHLLKTGESRDHRMLQVFTVNYLVAAVAAFAIGGFPHQLFLSETPDYRIFLFAGMIGLTFIANFLCYSKSIHLNGMGISVAAMRLSVLVPVGISLWLYGEQLDLQKGAGLVLVLIALALMIPRRGRIRFKKIDAAWLLLIVLILSGIADSSLKIYEEDFSFQLSELQFMGLVFSAAFLTGMALLLVRGGAIPNWDEAVTGLWIGIPNLYSSVFLIYALRGMEGSIAYPMVNILNVAGGALLGVLIWDDRISPRQGWGIGVATAAILLLI